MFTLQILDRGQSFLHSLDGSVVRIGSAADADLRLGEAGVLPQHARLEPAGDRVRLVATGPVRVNDRAVADAELQLGDRIEIGRAVLVVGRAVTRRATADEVLDDAPARRRSRGARTETKRKVPWVPIGAAAVVLAAVGWIATQRDDSDGIRDGLAVVARLCDDGRLEDAAATLGRLRQEWAKAPGEPLRLVDAAQERLDAIHAEIARIEGQVQDPQIARSYADWILELRRIEDSGQPIERVAARRVRATLRTTYDQRPAGAVVPDQVAAAAPPAEAPPPEPQPEPQPAAVAPPAPVATTPPPPPAPVSVPAPAPTDTAVVGDVIPTSTGPAGAAPVRLAAPGSEIDQLAQQGLFAQAMAVLQGAQAAAADPQQAAALQQRLDAIRAEAATRLQALVAEADRLVAAGRAGDAVAQLAAARFQFPGSPDFAALPQALQRAQQALTGVKPATDDEEEDDVAAPGGLPTLANAPVEGGASSAILELRGNMDAIRRADEHGEFGTVARLLHETAALVRERDAAFAERLETRAAAAELAGAWHEHVVAALAARGPLKATTRQGRAVTLRGADGEQLAASSIDGDARVSWREVSAFGLSLLVDATEPTGRAAVGAAALFYDAGDAARAEALLARVLPKEPALKPQVDGVLAHGRGEPVDARGYTLSREGFVSLRAVELRKEAQKFAARLDGVLRDRDPAAREALLAELLRGSADQVEVAVMALGAEVDRQLAKLQASPLPKQLEKLAAQRATLDAARAAALALIYDEVRYFYPYKPPAVSSDKFAEYNRVQAEVDRLVAELRTVWKDDRVRVRVPATLRADVERLDWTAATLARIGTFDPARLEPVAWARTLPALDSIGVRDYCLTAAECSARESWRAVEAFNAIATKGYPSAVRELLRITNDYRAMYGHRPLAITAVVCTAAQGHAEEMTRLGYFSHFSPVPGRTTPYDRMQLAGYTAGVSENIALCDSPSVAHDAWCHSSGHHRNLLDPGHHEIGIGVDGRNWVQNFGSGAAHEAEPAWAAAREQAR